MADTAEKDGQEQKDVDQNEPSQFVSDSHISNVSNTSSSSSTTATTTTHESGRSIKASKTKRLKMDRDDDDDGAPSAHMYPEHSEEEQTSPGERGGGAEARDSQVSFDSSCHSTPKKSSSKPRSAATTPQTPTRGHDLSLVDMKTSWDGSAASGGSTKGEATDGDTVGYKVPFKHRAGMLADPVKIAKEREKEERVRQARAKLKEERQKKLQELKEQQRIAQENREKQLEMRRRKIEDLRRRDFERRLAVEERRKVKEDIERARRESILQRAEERVARFEAWKAGGRKGGRGHVLGFGSATPRDICQPYGRVRRSSSHSALQRRSPNGSEMDSMRPQRRALSACSAVRRHCNVYHNRIGTPAATTVPTTPAQRPANVPGIGSILSRASMTTSMPSPVRMRENKPPRKQRPASVASSMPSFVGGEPAKSPRSKSTDRTGRDRSKTRPSRKDSKAVKDEATKTGQKPDETDEDDKEKDGDDGQSHGHKKEKKERVSLSFFDRLSTPKFSKKEAEPTIKESPMKKEHPAIRVQFADDDGCCGGVGSQDGVVEPERTSMKEKPARDPAQKHVTVKDPHRVVAPGSHVTSAGRSASPGRKDGERPAGKTSSPGHKGADKPIITATSRVTPPPSATATPTHGPSTAPGEATLGPPASGDDGTTTSRSMGGSAQDITAEEYKARLAEKRRQAREKAEREAEEERKRQELARLMEEERLRQEEEEERRMEEEALVFAESARKAEDERLQKAIQAEEKRRKEEAEKQESERKIREEAEKKAREDVERVEKEKQEKAKREEEDRIQRKKKLEMIMKRVKTDSSMDSLQKVDSPSKSVSSSPNISQLNSSHNSPEEHEKPLAAAENSDEEGPGSFVAEGSSVETYGSDMTSSLMQDYDESEMRTSTSSSASTVIHGEVLGEVDETASQNGAFEVRNPKPAVHSQMSSEDDAHGSEVSRGDVHAQLSAQVEDTSSDSKSQFRSPLLQGVVAETKSGDFTSQATKFKSPLLQNLLGKTKVGARMGLSSSSGDLSNDRSSEVPPLPSVGNGGTSKESDKCGQDEDKDDDTSLLDHHGPGTNRVGKDGGDGCLPVSTSKLSLDSSPLEATRLPISMMSDSALGSSIEQHGDGVMSQSSISNGHGDHKRQVMEDSSISLYSVEEGVTSTSSSSSVPASFDSLSQPVRAPPTQDDGQFEELIDLIDSASKTSPLVGGLPIRAFEANNRRSDVTESVS